MTAAVKQAQDERAERTKVTADMVVEELAKHAFGTMQDFFDPDDGHLLDVHEMSLAAKSRLAALDVGRERTRTRTSDGETVTTIEQTIKLKLWDKIRARPMSACSRCSVVSSATRTLPGPRPNDPAAFAWLVVLGGYLTVTLLVWPGLRATRPNDRPRPLLVVVNTFRIAYNRL